jgi:hypothetical protein
MHKQSRKTLIMALNVVIASQERMFNRLAAMLTVPLRHGETPAPDYDPDDVSFSSGINSSWSESPTEEVTNDMVTDFIHAVRRVLRDKHEMDSGQINDVPGGWTIRVWKPRMLGGGTPNDWAEKLFYHWLESGRPLAEAYEETTKESDVDPSDEMVADFIQTVQNVLRDRYLLKVRQINNLSIGWSIPDWKKRMQSCDRPTDWAEIALRDTMAHEKTLAAAEASTTKEQPIDTSDVTQTAEYQDQPQIPAAHQVPIDQGMSTVEKAFYPEWLGKIGDLLSQKPYKTSHTISQIMSIPSKEEWRSLWHQGLTPHEAIEHMIYGGKLSGMYPLPIGEYIEQVRTVMRQKHGWSAEQVDAQCWAIDKWAELALLGLSPEQAAAKSFSD